MKTLFIAPTRNGVGLSSHEGAKLALDVFVYRLAKLIAGMAVAFSGQGGGRFDGLVFTGGIGENSEYIRAATVERLGVLGLKLDPEANKGAVRGVSGLVSAAGSVPVLVVATNEELAIARETQQLVARSV